MTGARLSHILLSVNQLARHFEWCDDEPDCPDCIAWSNIMRIVRQPEMSFSDPMFDAARLPTAPESEAVA
ncbi:MAG: hypothetical protein O7A04_06785 [Acidobacteria bacterium]|nr:hypothetical protein [Acidobacteriota bacterium]